MRRLADFRKVCEPLYYMVFGFRDNVFFFVSRNSYRIVWTIVYYSILQIHTDQWPQTSAAHYRLWNVNSVKITWTINKYPARQKTGRFEVLPAVVMAKPVLWNMTPCRLVHRCGCFLGRPWRPKQWCLRSTLHDAIYVKVVSSRQAYSWLKESLECRRMEYKAGTEVIRLAVWARVSVFIHNLLDLMRRIVCMFAAAWRKWYCLKQLQTAAFYQGNTQQRLPWFDNAETFHPVPNIFHSLPSWSVSSFVLKTQRFLQNLLNETHNTSSQSKVNAHCACLWHALWKLNGNM